MMKRRQLYLGTDIENDQPLPFDPDHLTTHGVIFGMTGSGKTGLAVGMLEELVKTGVPIIAIDPKGDLPNLGLLFPDFEQQDFESWVDPSQARKKGLSTSDYAERQATAWREGLKEWGLDGQDVAALKERLHLRVFTPGSKALNPVDLLGDFAPPAATLPEEEKAELASGIITGLLSLVADNVDPLRDPRHVLLVQVLTEAWERNLTLTLEELISETIDPPFAKIGVFPVDKFYSPDDRMKLALQLNTIAASPTFSAWKSGRHLDIGALLEVKDGKVPVNIFTISHLSETERHFFVGRFMTELLSWSRSLSGTSSLRALIYFDEVAGYLPPHPHNPPAKLPLLTLLKQSRAVGVGLCLATQNPVDIDYKALSNIGTWMIGRLQTEQDRNRVRDGLLSAAGGLSRAELEAEFSKTKMRTFLVKQADKDRPHLLYTRHTMCYLRGPVTLTELGRLVASEEDKKSPEPVDVAAAPAPTSANRSTPPPLPTGFKQAFLDPRYVFHTRYEGRFEEYKEQARSDGSVLFRPALRAVLYLQFDEKAGGDFILHERHHYVAFPLDAAGSLAHRFEPIEPMDDDLLGTPPEGSSFVDLPEHLDEKEELDQACKELIDHLYRNLTATRFQNTALKLYSQPDESQEEFVARCEVAAEKLADQAAVKLQEKLKTKMDRLSVRLDKAREKVERLSITGKGKQTERLWKTGEALLGLFTKRRRSFSTVLTSSRQVLEADARTKAAEADVERLQDELLELQDDLETGLEAIEAEFQDKAAEVTEREVRLKRRDINVERFEIIWIPVSKRL